MFERALGLYEDRLSSLPNVVGLGIVDSPKGDGLALGVYVSRKVPLKNLKRAERIPKHLSLDWDRQERDIPTKVIEQGFVELESPGQHNSH